MVKNLPTVCILGLQDLIAGQVGQVANLCTQVEPSSALEQDDRAVGPRRRHTSRCPRHSPELSPLSPSLQETPCLATQQPFLTPLVSENAASLSPLVFTSLPCVHMPQGMLPPA